MRALAAALAVLALATQATGQDTQSCTLVSSGLTRSYLLHVPPAAASGQPLPLVLCFHAYTSSAAIMEQISGFSALADSDGFIVAYPQALPHAEAGNAPTWLSAAGDILDGNDRFIGDLLTTLQGTYAIDAHRIFVTGYSQGGGMCYIAAHAYPQQIAALAPVAVSLPSSLPFTAIAPARPMPVLMIHGTADTLVPYAGGSGILNVSYQPVPQLAWQWAVHDGCVLWPWSVDLINWDWFDGCTASVTTYAWGVQGSEVELITVQGGGHTWPDSRIWLPAFIFGNTCGDFDATATIWAFFQGHPLPGGIGN